MNEKLKLISEFVCEKVLIQYLAQRDSSNVSLVCEVLRGISEEGEVLWEFKPIQDDSSPVWMGGAELTLDKKLIHVWLSSCRRLKINPHTGCIVENIYQLT